jgi:hypothetical protein
MYYDYYTKIVDSILGDSDGTYISNHISSTSSDDLLSMMLEKNSEEASENDDSSES